MGCGTTALRWTTHGCYALFPSGGASALDSTKGTSRSESSFFGVFTRVDTGHIVISSDGNGFSRSRGSGSGPSQRS
jgi:hypothetical protein